MIDKTATKDKLAKLLAMEDIHVRHSSSAKTASFDTYNRVLTLPVWASLEDFVTDMLTGHEVGHSLWTPPAGWKEALDVEGIHKGILNIVEDARIEKKIKRKYPGIVRPFLQAYAELYKRNFFGTTPFEELGFIDRINLSFKLGSFSGIMFSAKEQPYVDLVGDCESWDDVVEISKILQMAYTEELTVTSQDHDFEVFPGQSGEGDPLPMEGLRDQQQSSSGEENDSPGEDSDEEEDGDGEKSEKTSNNKKDQSSIPNAEDFNADGKNALDEWEEFETESTWEDRKEELASEPGRGEYQYFSLPKANLDRMIVPFKEVISQFDIEMPRNWGDTHDRRLEHTPAMTMAYLNIEDNFKAFKTSSAKIVNYMAKEFERKKAAQEYRRVTISKTGVLDMNKIHQYKFNDDIFLKKTLQPDGKSHGLVMLVDWSASMQHIMLDTIKQTLNLVWFCQKVHIPFEVYGFSNCWHSYPDRDDYKDASGKLDYEAWNAAAKKASGVWDYKIGDAHGLNEFTNLLNLLSSRMTGSELTKMSKYLYQYAATLRNEEAYLWSNWKRLSLGSTPTVEALIGMQHIIPNFKRANKLDKVNLICLTDGLPNSKFDCYFNGYNEEGKTLRPGRLSFRLADHVIFDDPQSRKKYDLIDIMKREQKSGNWRTREETQVVFLLELLKDRYGVNCIGIFLNKDKSVPRRLIEKYLGWRRFNIEAHEKVRLGLRKDGFATIKNSGWDEYYIMPMGRMKMKNLNDDYEVAPNATVGKIKKAFTKSLNNKFGSRVLVDRMMTWIT